MNKPQTQVQVREIEHTPQIAPQIAALDFVAVSATQGAALDYYRLGLNVFPVVFGTKGAEGKNHFGKWGQLQATRLINPDTGKDDDKRAEALEIFLKLFDGVNLAIMTGRTSQNLTVLDCENEVVARKHAREFERRGLRPWIVRTRRGLHFWWFSNCECANNPDDKDTPRGWEIRGHSNYVIVPPSVLLDRNTGEIVHVYEWVTREGERPPVIEQGALDWLPIAPSVAPRGKALPFSDNPLAGLFKSTREFCESGTREGERNNRLFNAACDFQSKGWAQHTAHDYLMHGCDLSGYDKSFSRRDAERTIQSAYNKARKAPKPNYTPRVPTWGRAITWALSHKWQALEYTTTKRGKVSTRNVSANTARKVFVACCERARRDGREVFRAARREIAELASVRGATATNALRALVNAGYLLDRGTNDFDARLFAFPKNVQERTNTTEWLNSIGTLLHAGIKADVFSNRAGDYKGLGEVAGRVLDVIAERPYTVAQVATRLNCSASTVRRGLKRLVAHNIARKVGRLKWVGDSLDGARLQEIARTCGTLGRGQARKDTHTGERAQRITNQMARNKYKREQRAATSKK